jgi:hypothetical protein
VVTRQAHRVSWEMANGPIPKGMQVCHRCDNPPCVRPDHFFLGSAKENKADQAAKGRTPVGDRHWSRLKPDRIVRGEQQGRAKLTDDVVRDIRSSFASGETRQELARRFGVSWPVVDGVVKRTLWKHVA